MSIWQLDNSQLEIIIESILKLPGITYIEIKENIDLVHKNIESSTLGTIIMSQQKEPKQAKILFQNAKIKQ